MELKDTTKKVPYQNGLPKAAFPIRSKTGLEKIVKSPGHRKGTKSLGTGLDVHKEKMQTQAPKAKRRKYRKAESVQLSPNFGHRTFIRDSAGTHHRKSSSRMPNLIRHLHQMNDDPLNANQSMSDTHSSNKMIPARITDHDGKMQFRMVGHPTVSVILDAPHQSKTGVFGGRVFSNRGVFGALLYVEAPGSCVSVLTIGGSILRAAETLHLNFETRQRDWYPNLNEKQLKNIVEGDIKAYKRNAEALSAGGWHTDRHSLSSRRQTRNSRNMSGVILHDRSSSARMLPGFTQALKLMKDGSQMLRIGGRRKIVLQKFTLSRDCTCLEGAVQERSNRSNLRIPIVQIHKVTGGPSPVFEAHQDLRYGNNRMPLSHFRDSTFTITWGPKNECLDVVAPSPTESQLWIAGLQELVRRAATRRTQGRHSTQGFNLNSIDNDTEEFKLFKATLHETIHKLDQLQTKMQKLTRGAITQVEIMPIVSVILEDAKVVESLTQVWTKDIFRAHSVEVLDSQIGANSIVFPLKTPAGPETLKVLRSRLCQAMGDMVSQMPPHLPALVKEGIRKMQDTVTIEAKYHSPEKQRDCKTTDEVTKMLTELRVLKREVTDEVGRMADGFMKYTMTLCKAELRVGALGMYVQKRLNSIPNG